MATRARKQSPEGRFDAIQQELEENKMELTALEGELGRDSSNPFLLKKYERLSKREALLLEERRLWAGAVLDNHNWQVGLQAAPGVNALLERVVAAGGPTAPGALHLHQPGSGQQAGGDGRGRGGRKRGRPRGPQLASPDKAQLMLLANAADASGTGSLAGGRGRGAKRRAGGAVRPFHVAKSAPPSDESDGESEGSPVEVPVVLSQEQRLADYARDRLADSPGAQPAAAAAAGERGPAAAEALGSRGSAGSPTASLEAQAGSPVRAAEPTGTAAASTQEEPPAAAAAVAGVLPEAASAAELATKARLLEEAATPAGSTTALPQAAEVLAAAEAQGGVKAAEQEGPQPMQLDALPGAKEEPGGEAEQQQAAEPPAGA